METNGARDTSHLEAVTFLVAKRLASIEGGLLNDKQHLVPEPPCRERTAPPTFTEARSNLLTSISAQGHSLHRQDKLTVCSRCRRRRRTTITQLWIHTPCNGRPADDHDNHADQQDERTLEADQSTTTQQPGTEVGKTDEHSAPLLRTTEHNHAQGADQTAIRVITLAKRRRIMGEQRSEARI